MLGNSSADGQIRARHTAVLFDVDGTLIDHDGAALRALPRWLARAHPEDNRDTSLDAWIWFEVQDVHYPRFAAGELTFFEQRRQRAREFCRRTRRVIPETDAAADSWWKGLLSLIDTEIAAYPDTPATLRRLREAGFTVGAVSNSEPEYQRSKLVRTGLAELVPSLTCCADAGGLGKPYATIFHVAAEAVGATPERTAYVGNNLDDDAEAALAAGLTGIWLNRTGKPGRPSAGVRVIESVSELDALLLGA